MKNKGTVTLQEMKAEMQRRQKERDAEEKRRQIEKDDIINVGRLAFKMGIEPANCPIRNDEGKRKLWLTGYDLESEKFKSQFKREPRY